MSDFACPATWTFLQSEMNVKSESLAILVLVTQYIPIRVELFKAAGREEICGF